MTTCPFTLRRLLLIGGFIVATAAVPTIAINSAPTPGAALAQCVSGEEHDTFTTTCTPFMVPNSPGGFTTTAANPDVPEVDGIPCIGRSGDVCVGLAEDQPGPQPVPRVTISSSP